MKKRRTTKHKRQKNYALSVESAKKSASSFDAGFDVDIATTPEEAAALLMDSKYHVIIYDDAFQEMDAEKVGVIKVPHHSSTQLRSSSPPQFGERVLLLIIPTKDERASVLGDLEEEYRSMATKQGEWFAKVWYYKQVIGSAWPLVLKGVKWGMWAWIGEWIRRLM